MKEAYYFSHDSNARHDPKMTAMRGAYGAEGYGWFWMLIEMMMEASDYKLDMHSKYTFNAFALQLQAESMQIEKFVHDCINEFDLFASDGHYFWSESLLRRMQKRKKISESRSKAANKRWKNANASESDANAMQNDAKESKGKESKRNKKEIKKNKYAEFVTLTQEEYDKLISSFGEDRTKRMVEILNNYKGSKGKTYKSDYLAILNWVVKRVEEEGRKYGGGSGIPKHERDSKPGYGGSDRKITSLDQTSSVGEFSDEELSRLI